MVNSKCLLCWNELEMTAQTWDNVRWINFFVSTLLSLILILETTLWLSVHSFFLSHLLSQKATRMTSPLLKGAGNIQVAIKLTCFNIHRIENTRKHHSPVICSKYILHPNHLNPKWKCRAVCGLRVREVSLWPEDLRLKSLDQPVNAQ